MFCGVSGGDAVPRAVIRDPGQAYGPERRAASSVWTWKPLGTRLPSGSLGGPALCSFSKLG